MANAFVNRRQVGTLFRAEPVNLFTYGDDTPGDLAVSLLMPIMSTPYQAERATVLHPIFDMSLPEGALREALNTMFAKALPVFDDLALLEIVGRSLIGRIRFGPTSMDLDQVPAQNLRELLANRGTDDLFRDLLTRYASYSGISGVQPKFLIRDDGSLSTPAFSPIAGAEKVTAHGSTHIVKSFDPQKFPGLGANEYLCLQAARRAGLQVPSAELARDGKLLVIERFDLRSDGSYHAFEDGCALAGRLSRDKYEGSYEQLAGTLAGVVNSVDGTQAELAKFFRSLVLSVAVRNGDAHRKNFGVMYDGATKAVWVAPTFDVVTTTAYIRLDSLALTLDGTKRWPTGKRLQRFGVQRCRLTPHDAQQIVSEVAEAVELAFVDFDIVAEKDPAAKETFEAMRVIWAEGIVSLRE
jgi:serine/threonine-protein kinase HipA